MPRRPNPHDRRCYLCHTRDPKAFAPFGRTTAPVCRKCAAKKLAEYANGLSGTLGRGRRYAIETTGRRTRTMDEIDDHPPLPPEDERAKILERLIANPEF